MEIWKRIDTGNDTGFGVYEVSNEGRVRRVYSAEKTIRRNNSQYKYLKPVRHKGNRTDYFDVQIGRGKRELIHRLVAKAFIPNPENLETVNHKNGIGTDNRVENLEWLSVRDNCLHAKANGWTRPGHESVPIKCIETEMIFGSSFEAADFVNKTVFHDSHRIKSLACNIRAAASGKRPKAYGYRWTKA